MDHSAQQHEAVDPKLVVDELDRNSSTPIQSTPSSSHNPNQQGQDEVASSRQLAKQHRARPAKRLIGRTSIDGSTSSLHSLASYSSLDSSLRADLRPVGEEGPSIFRKDGSDDSSNHAHTNLVAQISQWIKAERDKRQLNRHMPHRSLKHGHQRHHSKNLGEGASTKSPAESEGADLDVSEDDSSFNELEKILEESLAGLKVAPQTYQSDRRPSLANRRRSSVLRRMRKSSTAASSDTDYYDGDLLVPSCEAVLDNSKATACTNPAGEPSCQSEADGLERFKNDIVRLAHTLKLKGWRKVPLDRGSDITVKRLSGALTNAVYVVSPPKDLRAGDLQRKDSAVSIKDIKAPSQLLLRIYGPQVEHLIDRESELQILRRLCKRNIGPKMLGTFTNGRFEEFLHATTLTAPDLKVPATSKQIAKRMRELHDGIELLEDERDAGPSVWKNWDKWIAKTEEICLWLDKRNVKRASEKQNHIFVCGTEWGQFKDVVSRYRAWLEEKYGGPAGVKQHLVFAHNDTQYGNLLRLEPSGQSPLLLPANEHKRLVVIDFEYASANLPGYEFANHFSEWCYDYSTSDRPYAFHIPRYPSAQEQKRFIEAYVRHQPLRGADTTPSLRAIPSAMLHTSTSSISTFTLDSRTPPSQTAEDDVARDDAVSKEVQRLLAESRLWRMANSAFWVSWGIVQANVPEMTDGKDDTKESDGQVESSEQAPVEDDSSSEEDFDYLSYSRERALFFWGDAVNLGIIKREEIPDSLVQELKIVKY
ncbi:MAG: hypothetical protein M1814_004316 [Vezdaea aestivalis]|nr:MAG: hypothetical protein M1814_004316 [Vezdaea aestivalis]